MTETTTEYKEVTDDSDFAGFDTSAFPGKAEDMDLQSIMNQEIKSNLSVKT